MPKPSRTLAVSTAFAAFAAFAAVACSTTSTVEPSDEPVLSDEPELIACGFIQCPRGMRCESRRDGGAPDAAAEAGNDARLRTYGVCVADPCSIQRCPIRNTRCIAEEVDGSGSLSGNEGGALRARCIVSPCTMINCLSGTQCVEKPTPSGMLQAVCEQDPCAWIRCIGGMRCEPQDTAAGRMGICVR